MVRIFTVIGVLAVSVIALVAWRAWPQSAASPQGVQAMNVPVLAPPQIGALGSKQVATVDVKYDRFHDRTDFSIAFFDPQTRRGISLHESGKGNRTSIYPPPSNVTAFFTKGTSMVSRDVVFLVDGVRVVPDPSFASSFNIRLEDVIAIGKAKTVEASVDGEVWSIGADVKAKFLAFASLMPEYDYPKPVP